MANKRDFDCDLGRSFEEASELSESIRIDEMEKVGEVEAGVAYELGLFRTEEEMARLYELLKEAYDRLSAERPEGMSDGDVEILDKLSMELCKKHVNLNTFDPTKNRHMQAKDEKKGTAAPPPPPPPPPAAPSTLPPPVVERSRSYNLSINKKSYGPYTVETLRGYVSEGRFAPQTLVWSPGFPGWVPASDVPELAALFAPPPPPGTPPEPPAPPPVA